MAQFPLPPPILPPKSCKSSHLFLVLSIDFVQFLRISVDVLELRSFRVSVSDSGLSHVYWVDLLPKKKNGFFNFFFFFFFWHGYPVGINCDEFGCFYVWSVRLMLEWFGIVIIVSMRGVSICSNWLYLADSVLVYMKGGAICEDWLYLTILVLMYVTVEAIW